MSYEMELAQRIKNFERRLARSEKLDRGWSFVPLTTPLTSTDFDGDSFSTTAKTKIDLSAKFGVPAGIKAINLGVSIRDSGSLNTDCFLIFSPNNTAGQGIGATCPRSNNAIYRSGINIPCDANGDIYYQVQASGAGTLNAWITVYGYWS